MTLDQSNTILEQFKHVVCIRSLCLDNPNGTNWTGRTATGELIYSYSSVLLGSQYYIVITYKSPCKNTNTLTLYDYAMALMVVQSI